MKALQNKKKLETRGAPSLQNVLQLAKTGLSSVFFRRLLSHFTVLIVCGQDSHLPPHGSREVIIILGSLTSCDPTNIHQTITETEAARYAHTFCLFISYFPELTLVCASNRIRVNIIGLAADMKICRDISEQTKGTFLISPFAHSPLRS